ncbi:MAG: hypothetical protein NZ761_08675 [Dehalococcoidia bacterium]|nr:hypothetical protein [Dehalococcoidia bacterium]
MTGNGTERWFELVLRDRPGVGREVVLWQVERTPGDGRRAARPRRRRVGGLVGRPLTVAEPEVRQVLGKADAQRLERDKCVRLVDTAGARLGVLFLALRPLRRVERMVRVLEGVQRLADEEAYYWFAQCTAPSRARRARRALRVLLAGE